MDHQVKYLLDESEIPRQWYNMIPDLPAPPPPPLHPGTGQPVGPEDLAPLFPMELIRQEVATDPYIAIPEDVLDVYRLWRPTPLYRAHRLEKALNTPARIYYKYEGVSPAGSHKPNTAVPQAYYNAAEGTKRLAAAGESAPDLIVGCTGGGSNFAGLFFPFLREKLAGRSNPVIRAVEPSACPSFTRGRYAYDFGDTAGFTPLLKMHTLGHDFIPDPVHAGGLRYHGMSPLLSHMYELGLFEAESRQQRECFAAAVTFARAEGIIPAPEPTHALASVIEEAKRCTESGEQKVILTALCGHGHFDMAAYERYLSGEMEDFELSQERIDDALSRLPQVQ